jgi:Cyclic nucleotide-binding domain
VSDQGKEAVVAFLKAGDFIGEGCLTGRPRCVSTARAVEDSVVTRMDKPTIVRVFRDEPKFSKLFTAHLLARAIRIEEDLVDQLFNSSEKRLARALLLLANFGKDGRQEPVIAKPDLPLAAQDPDQLLWKIYKGADQRGHGARHVVHGHHQFRDGPVTIEGRTNLDTQAWYTGRLVVGVFDDEVAGGPVSLLEVHGEPVENIV